MADNDEIAEARQRMIARRFGGQSAATGGKGTVRRKHKAVHKTATSDDKKLGSTLKKLGVTNIPAIEEVNLFTTDQKVIHFSNPKVQASIAANTYVVSGPNETKPLAEMLPGILNQVSFTSFLSCRNFANVLRQHSTASTLTHSLITVVSQSAYDEN